MWICVLLSKKARISEFTAHQNAIFDICWIKAASMSVTSVLYLKDEVSIATAGAVNRNLGLTHWYGDNVEEVVVEGSVASTDPNTKVHHVPLGRDFWSVKVDLVFNSEVILVRTNR
ncbi:hypothetical protein Dsin_027843 [Dipteronia sinensis]|uniref:Uncharacterized protein n=1 Tax=Dipteronia sinensis TaxID=43782 RepID=A0AAD9ZPQ4_9ROSI|nr:hypothetical protein Dsin_027843 [Dipteronia sinensis]